MRKARAFTLVELLVVILIIGVLAAIAIPRFSRSKERTYLTAMKSDLRNLVTAQEAYQSSAGTYTTSLAAMSVSPSPGVTLTVTAADSAGWSATAAHSATARTCGIYMGTGAPPVLGGQAGEAVCN